MDWTYCGYGMTCFTLSASCLLSLRSSSRSYRCLSRSAVSFECASLLCWPEMHAVMG